MCNWFKANKLSVNAGKTNYMMLGTSHTTNKYTYGNVDSSDDAQWARMNSKCAKNKSSFKTLEKVNVASNQGVCGPVEYDGHIFKTV